jgi:cell division septum initiation protein DivIVA
MEILGLLDTLESIILDSSKIPFTKKAVVDEEKVLSIIDKIRLVIQGGGDFAKKAITRGESPAGAEETKEAALSPELEGRSRAEAKAVEVIEQAYRMAKEVREGADKYADEVLANLEATSTRILRTIKAGRERLSKTTQAGSEQ